MGPRSSVDTYVIDWRALRAELDAGDVARATDEERLDFMREAFPVALVGSSAISQRFQGHREAWGFDSTDLDWEAGFFVAGDRSPSVRFTIVRFAEGFDLAPVIARFDERDFEREPYGGAVIYTRGMGGAGSWVTATDVGILNTAVLADGRTLVLASSSDDSFAEERLRARIDSIAGGPPRQDEVTADFVRSMDGRNSVVVRIAPDLCREYTPEPGPYRDEEAVATARALADQAGPLADYAGFALAMRAVPEATMRFAFVYLDAADAEADLEGRRLLVEDGVSLQTGRRFDESVFTVTGAAATGHVLAIDLAPVGDAPPAAAVLRHVTGRDLIFAGCGS